MTPANTALHPLATRPLVHTALYIRVSTEEQKLQGYSLPHQLDVCQRYAAQYGLSVDPAHIFQDAESGTTSARTALDALRLAVRRREIQAVIFFNVTRFMRNYTEMILILAEFTKAGVEIYDTGTPPAPLTPVRKLNLHVQGAIAEFDRDQIMQRTEDGRRGRAQAGYPLPQHASFGYRYVGDPRKGTYVIIEEEAVIVRRIFHLYVIERLGIRAIAHLLSLERIPTYRDRRPGARYTRGQQRAPGLWSDSMIHRILHNRSYIGTKLYGTTKRLPKDPIGLKNQERVATPQETWITIDVPQIITPELFAQAALQAAANTRHALRNTKHFYLLGGERLKCGLCKRTMGGSGKGPYRYYRCNRSGGGLPDECHRTMHAGKIEAYVWERVQYLLKNPQVLLAFFDAQLGGLDATSTLSEQRRLEQAIAEADEEAQLLLDAYLKKKLSADRMHAKHTQIDQENDARRLRLRILESQYLTYREQAAYRHTLTLRLETFREYCETLGDDGPSQQALLDSLGLTVVWWEEELTLHVQPIREPLRPEDGFPLAVTFQIASTPSRRCGFNRETDRTITLTYACPWPAGGERPAAGAMDGPTASRA